MIKLFQSIKSRLIFFLALHLPYTYCRNYNDVLLQCQAYPDAPRTGRDGINCGVKKRRVLCFLDARSGRVIDFSSDGFIKDSLETITRGGVHKDEAISALSRHLSTNKKPLDHYIVAIAVVDKEGKVIASTKETIIGVDVSGREPFLEATKKAPIKPTSASLVTILTWMQTACLSLRPLSPETVTSR